MSSIKTLEINGNLTAHPLAELLVEIHQSRLNGSLRLSYHTNKTIVYVKDGEVVFAVANQRRHRLFELLLREGAVTRQQLVEIPEFTNDFALAEALWEKAVFSENEVKSVFSRQIEGVLREAIVWHEGSWTFSPLARVKEDIHYKIDTAGLLVEHGRNMSKDAVIRRFKSFKETFGKCPTQPAQINLLPQEAFLLSRFDNLFWTIEEIKAMSHWSDMETLQRLYALWLAGFLYRENWDRAFKEQQLAAISAAKFEIKKPVAATVPAAQNPAPKTAEVKKSAPVLEKKELTLDKYLAQVENAETHYQLLNVPHSAAADEIKRAYFNLAKRFHPDLYHKQTDAKTQTRIQQAFTEIAHAYEILRDEERRKNYDFKLRKYLDELEKLSPAERDRTKNEQKTLTSAPEIFEHGMNLLMNEEYEQAMPYLLRAIHLSPETARYHAYYGMLLAVDKNQRFKAESELQAAVRLEPQNPEFRVMLAEFFIQYNLRKRAEGELNRLLAMFPDHKEARVLLDSLR